MCQKAIDIKTGLSCIKNDIYRGANEQYETYKNEQNDFGVRQALSPNQANLFITYLFINKE